jgi:hypothetical protein
MPSKEVTRNLGYQGERNESEPAEAITRINITVQKAGFDCVDIAQSKALNIMPSLHSSFSSRSLSKRHHPMQLLMVHLRSYFASQTVIPPSWYGDHTPLTDSLILFTGFVTLLSFSPDASRNNSAFCNTCCGARFRTQTAFCLPLI